MWRHSRVSIAGGPTSLAAFQAPRIYEAHVGMASQVVEVAGPGVLPPIS